MKETVQALPFAMFSMCFKFFWKQYFILLFCLIPFRLVSPSWAMQKKNVTWLFLLNNQFTDHIIVAEIFIVVFCRMLMTEFCKTVKTENIAGLLI